MSKTNKFLKNLKEKRLRKCRECKKLFLSEKDIQGISYKTRCLSCSEYMNQKIRKKVFNNEINLIDLRIKPTKN